MTILYFAWLRSKIGSGVETLSPPETVTTVAEVIEWLKTLSDGHRDAFADLSVVRVAVNQDYVDLAAPVAVGDEIAFFPPVTGG